MAKFKFSLKQYSYYSSAFKNLAEGIILGASGAYFLPEVFQMPQAISVLRFIILFLTGILFLVVGGIMSVRGKVK